MESDKTILVLCDKRWLLSRKSLLTAIVIFVAFNALLFAYISTVIFPNSPWDNLLARLPELLNKFVNNILTKMNRTDAVLNLVMLGFLFGQILYLTRAQKWERLTLSLDGIRYTSPLPSILKKLKPDWYLPWSQVSTAKLGTFNGRVVRSEQVQLTLFSSAEKRSIFPTLWVDSEEYTSPRPRLKFTLSIMTQSHDEILKSVMESEVLQYISRNVPHLSINSTLNKTEISTSLEKNPHGRIAIGVISLLMIYTLVDLILGPESYIDDPLSLLYIYIPAGIFGVILSSAWLYKSTLAIAEKIGLALLIGVLVAVAMVPGALRINALTDSNSVNTFDYFVKQDNDGVILHPVVDGMPSIDYFAKNSFWEKFSKDDTYPVVIHKGRLGFYQFNSSVIVNDIHLHEKN